MTITTPKRREMHKREANRGVGGLMQRWGAVKSLGISRVKTDSHGTSRAREIGEERIYWGG